MLENVYENLPEQDFRAFIGPNFDRFERIRRLWAQGHKRLVWSWPWLGVLHPPIWFAYRKLTVPFIVYHLFFVLFGTLDVFIGDREEMRIIDLAFSWIVLSLFVTGRQFVVKRALRFIQRADAEGLTGEERTSFLSAHGGVSTWYAILLPPGALVLALMVIFLIAAVANEYGIPTTWY